MEQFYENNSVHDWLTGVKVADTGEAEQMLQPAKVRDRSLDDLTDADRVRMVYSLITGLPSEGGAGIYPGETPFVEGVLGLHDWDFNKVSEKKGRNRCGLMWDPSFVHANVIMPLTHSLSKPYHTVWL